MDDIAFYEVVYRWFQNCGGSFSIHLWKQTLSIHLSHRSNVLSPCVALYRIAISGYLFQSTIVLQYGCAGHAYRVISTAQLTIPTAESIIVVSDEINKGETSRGVYTRIDNIQRIHKLCAQIHKQSALCSNSTSILPCVNVNIPYHSSKSRSLPTLWHWWVICSLLFVKYNMQDFWESLTFREANARSLPMPTDSQ